MGDILHLQDFSAPEPAPTQAISDAELEQAYADGVAAGRAAAEAERAMVDQSLASQLEAHAFTFAEARRDTFQQLEPLMQAIAAQLVPRLAKASLTARLAETLLAFAEDSVDAALTVRVHPDHKEAITQALVSHDMTHVTCSADPGLRQDALEFGNNRFEAVIDLEAMIAEFTAAVAGFSDQLQHEENHG